MKYFCRCKIERWAKATCPNIIDVPTFKTYQTGFHNTQEGKTYDSTMRFCKSGTE